MPAKKPRRRVPHQRANRLVDYAQTQGVPVPVRVVSKTVYAQQAVAERENDFSDRQPLTQIELETMADTESVSANDLTRKENRDLDELRKRTMFSKVGKTSAMADAIERRRVGVPPAYMFPETSAESSGGFPAEVSAIASRPTASRRRTKSGILDRTISDRTAASWGTPGGTPGSVGSPSSEKRRRRRQLFAGESPVMYGGLGSPTSSGGGHIGRRDLIEREQRARDRQRGRTHSGRMVTSGT